MRTSHVPDITHAAKLAELSKGAEYRKTRVDGKFEIKKLIEDILL